jgi:RHS repeat-associated protein
VTQTTSDCTASGTGASTLALVWNALDHLQTATRTGSGAIAESYQYDDQGRRIAKTSAATTTHWLYDGDAIHAEWTGTMSGLPSAVYAHGGLDQPLLRLTGTTHTPAATQSAYLQDGLGSVVGLANASGTLTASQRFDAWGNRTASTGTIPQYGYTGREPDATGLVYYRARYYHPGIGRFASRDPMGMADGERQPVCGTSACMPRRCPEQVPDERYRPRGSSNPDQLWQYPATDRRLRSEDGQVRHLQFADGKVQR